MRDPTIAECRADLAEAEIRRYQLARTALDRALGPLEVDECRRRLRQAMRRKVRPYVQPTLEQIFNKLAAAGVEIVVNRSTA